MANSQWDKHLRDILGDFKSEGEAPHWDEFSQQLDANSLDLPISDPLTDENLKSQLANYIPPVPIEGWERIESTLDQQHKEFDKTVREKVQQYGPQYDPLSWPVFLKRLTNNRRLRIQLVALKTIEFGAILLFLLTVVNMGRLGKFPFDVPATKDSNTIQHSNQVLEDRAYLDNQINTKDARANNQTNQPQEQKSVSGLIANNEVKFNTPLEMGSTHPGNQNSFLAGNALDEVNRNSKSQNTLPRIDLPYHNPQLSLASSPLQSISNSLSGIKPNAQNLENEDSNHPYTGNKLQFAVAANMLESLPVHVDHSPTNQIPAPNFVRQLKGTYLEFGMLAQADFNRLRMPEDRLYSAGKEIVFPEQGIPSHGFGGGFTIALGHPLWALETGIIYSAKDFEPGRQLIVGGAFDNGSVEFEAMKLQLVSVPIQYRYRFDNKGKLKAYGLAGFGLHVIARSDIDVLIKYHFPSLSAGENPNNNPALAQTIRETRRIREHIRDGAPFSSKSFFSANAGLGLEYNMTPHKILFLQTALQYQIPNLRFSNNNGKNIQSVSVQAGVRTPIGN